MKRLQRYLYTGHNCFLILILILIAGVALSTNAGADNLMLDHFSGGTPGAQPLGWYDASDGVTPPGEMVYTSTDSYASITVTGTAGWAKVTQYSMNVDLSRYTKVEVVISALHNATVRVGVFHVSPYQFWNLTPASLSEARTYQFDIPSVTGETGLQNYALQLSVEGNQWAAAIFDSIRIYSEEPTLTNTQTHSITTTPSITPTPTFSDVTLSPTMTPSVSPTFTMTPTSSLNVSKTMTVSPTLTCSCTATPVPSLLGWIENFDAPGFPPSGWSPLGVELLAENGVGVLTVISPLGYGKIESDALTLDVGRYPYLIVQTEDVAPMGIARGIIQIQEVGGDASAFSLSPGITSGGTLSFNYASATGWTGFKDFKVVVWLENGQGNKLWLDSMQILAQLPTPTVTATSTLQVTPVVSRFRPSVNLFRPGFDAMTFYLELPKASSARVDVFSLNGKKIRRLFETDSASASAINVPWDGKDENGDWVASGIYLIRLETDGFQKNIRIAVVR